MMSGSPYDLHVDEREDLYDEEGAADRLLTKLAENRKIDLIAAKAA